MVIVRVGLSPCISIVFGSISRETLPRIEAELPSIAKLGALGAAACAMSLTIPADIFATFPASLS